MKQESLIFYTNPMSRGMIARWALEEVGRAYETRVIQYGAAMKSPEYLAINPMGKVPALQHGEAIVTETVAICAYLAQAFPEAKLAPEAGDRKAQADYYRSMFLIAGPLEAATTDRVLGVNVPEEKRGFVGYGSFELVLNVLECAIKGKTYIAGEQFSAADLVTASYLSFHTEFGVIPANPIFENYIKIHKNRPAALRAAKIDADLLTHNKAT